MTVTDTRNKVKLIALAIALIFAWSAATPLRASAGPLRLVLVAVVSAVKPGDKVDVNLKTTDGRMINGNNIQGKILVVSFWATSCPHCRAALDRFRKIDTSQGDKGVQVVAICYDRNAAELKKAIKKHKLTNWPHVLANQQPGGLKRVQRNWSQDSFPHVFILSPDGRVNWRGHPDKMQRPLQRAVKKHEAHLMAGRWTSRVEALEVLAEIEGLLRESNKHAQIARVVASLPLDSLQDAMVVDRAAALLPELESEAVVAAIEKEKAAQRVFDAMQTAVAERSAKVSR